MDNQLTACEVAAAMAVWHMAIQAKLNAPSTTSIEVLAKHYGQYTSTPENIDAVSHFFDWSKIMEFIYDQE